MNTGFIPAHELGRCGKKIVSDICSPKKSTVEMEHPKAMLQSPKVGALELDFYDFPSLGNN
jgi:hypothetical protein